MLTEFLTIGVVILLSAMLPGPDFALVTKNTIVYSRRAGLFTTLGITAGLLVHITYCSLGLALVISQSAVLFNLIKYVGAIYLFYLGATSILTKPANVSLAGTAPTESKQNAIFSDLKAFQQGFLCNALNPKATLFFLALFTAIIKPDTPLSVIFLYGIEVELIAFTWFSALTLTLSHPSVMRSLNKVEKYISTLMGVFLIGFGIALLFIHH